eukprot:c15375_g1_i1 orf=147-785(+)
MDEHLMERIQRASELLRTTGSWEQCWSQGVTPWDLGDVTPIIAYLVSKNRLPVGKALVPGCGLGRDVVALANPDRHVTGLDISDTAIELARQMASTGPSARWVEFISTDFFTYSPSVQFNLIFDYTFFCALGPSLWPKWGEKMAELLALDGELITIIYPVDGHEGGPPYAVSLELYEKVLHPWGIRNTFFEENTLSPSRRKGREFIARWRKV